ncbi:hypothetical protein AgCh_038365 [Apium graveolens]
MKIECSVFVVTQVLPLTVSDVYDFTTRLSLTVLQEPYDSYTTTAEKDPGTARKEQPRHQKLSFGARRRGSPSFGLGAPEFTFTNKLSRESISTTFVIVIGIFETMSRSGKYTSGRPSASTQVQEPDHPHAQDPGVDQETLQEQPPQHTPVLERIINPRDARSLIKLNQYKYTNVPVAKEHMANLTSNELAEAIRLYRQEQARIQEEAELVDEPEESGDSQQSKRSVFDRIRAKGKKNQKDQGNKKEAELAKQKRLEELME